MKAVRSNLPKLARVPLDIGGQFTSWSLMESIKVPKRQCPAQITGQSYIPSLSRSFSFLDTWIIDHRHIKNQVKVN